MVCMNQARCVFTVISQANHQLKCIVVHLLRAQSSFLVEESLDNAIKELKETQKLLEIAKLNYSYKN